MIPVNNAIWVAVTCDLVTAIVAVLACAAFWRARVSDAYADGHTAGIQTQIGRHARAEHRKLTEMAEQLHPGYWPSPAWTAGEPATEIIVADVTTAARYAAGPALPVVPPFARGPLAGLRYYPAPPASTPDATGERLLP